MWYVTKTLVYMFLPLGYYSEEVSVLTHFKEAHIQIGDKSFYKLTEDDIKTLKASKEKTKPGI